MPYIYINTQSHIGITDIKFCRQLRMHFNTSQRILTNHEMHPYGIVLYQALNEDQFDPNHYFVTLQTDEDSFANNAVNNHNMHYWFENNLQLIWEVNNQHIWGALTGVYETICVTCGKCDIYKTKVKILTHLMEHTIRCTYGLTSIIYSLVVKYTKL